MNLKLVSTVFLTGLSCASMTSFAEERLDQVVDASESIDSSVLAKIHNGYQTSVLAVVLTDSNAADKRVKDYAIALMRQQQVAENAVQQIANAASIPIVPYIPVTPEEIAHARVSQEVAAGLQELEGHAFDVRFLQVVIAENEWTMGWLQAQRSQIANPFIRALVNGYLAKAVEIRQSATALLKDLGQ